MRSLVYCLVLALAVVVTAQEVRVGEPLNYRVTLPQADSILIADPPGIPVRSLPVTQNAMLKGGEFEFRVAVYDTGRFTIPTIPVLVFRGGQVSDTVWTAEREVFVTSTLADSVTTPRPLKPYEEHPLRLADVLREYWPWALCALILAALVYAYIRYRRRPHELLAEAAPPPVPAAELAVRELIALRDKKYPERGMMKEHFSEFSEVLRRYLEGRFAFPALEMTTYELAKEFRTSELPAIFTDELLPLLKTADMVKFAKEIPTLDAAAKLIEAGFEIVEQTRPRPDEKLVEQAQ